MRKKGGISVPSSIIWLAGILVGLIVLVLIYFTLLPAGNTAFGPLDELVRWKACWMEYGRLCPAYTS